MLPTSLIYSTVLRLLVIFFFLPFILVGSFVTFFFFLCKSVLNCLACFLYGRVFSGFWVYIYFRKCLWWFCLLFLFSAFFPNPICFVKLVLSFLRCLIASYYTLYEGFCSPVFSQIPQTFPYLFCYAGLFYLPLLRGFI